MSDTTWRYEADVREEDGKEYIAGFNVYDSSDREIIGCEGILGNGENDAKLIAAAPELKTAVERLLVCMRLANWEDDDSAKYARAILAKVTP